MTEPMNSESVGGIVVVIYYCIGLLVVGWKMDRRIALQWTRGWKFTDLPVLCIGAIAWPLILIFDGGSND